MKKILFVLLGLGTSLTFAQTPCVNGMAGGFPCDGLTLQSHIPIAQMGGKNYSGNNPMEATDSWGWTDPQDGKEYAIVCMNDGTAFVDISTPTAPRFLGRLETHTGTSWWRDVKVFNNHAYIVSDSNGSHGVQIFDLTRLRGLSTSPGNNSSMRTFTRDGRYSGVGSAHNVIINEDTGYLYILGSNRNSGGPRILDLNSNPKNPTRVGDISGLGYCHDAQVVVYDGPDTEHHGKELLIGSFSGNNRVYVLDVTNKSSYSIIGSVTYPNREYTHQGWFTKDKKFFIVGDEVDEETIGGETRTFVFDMEDLDNPTLHYTHYGATDAIDHNGYVVGNRFYLANYNAGIRVMKVDGLYDENNPSMTEVAYMDTHPSTDAPTFYGAWNVYPFFESGNLVVSDLVEGLVVVRDPNFDNTDPVANCQNFTAYLDKNTGSVTIDATDVDNGSTDNIGIVKRTLTGQTTFTCADVGNSFQVTLTVEDDYGYNDSCTATVTVAAAPTTYSGGNWSNGAPGPGSAAVISQNYNTATNGSIDACTCEIDANRTLTVGPENYLNATKDITVNGNLIVEHQGSVVQTDDNATAINNGTINVNYTTPYMVPRVFVVMGRPMTAETRAGVFANSYMFLNHDTDKFVPNEDVEDQFPGAENFADDNYDNWAGYAGITNPGEGYIARPQLNGTDGNKTYNMTFEQGTLNTGDINFTVKYNGTKNASPNVLANPYPSAISADDFINANAMVDEVYFWNPLTPPSPLLPGAYTMNFSMEDISMYNLLGGNVAASDPGDDSTLPTGYISTGQGFGIKATAAGTATFTNAMRVTDNNNTALRPANDTDRIWISVKNEQYQMQNTTLVGFSELATPGIDQGYDSRRLATVLSLYTHLENGNKEFGIQAREAFTDGAKVPMGFSSLLDESLEYTISIADIEGANLPEATVFLTDHELNITVNLTDEDYIFKAAKGTYNGRFTLQFRGEEVLGPIDTALANISVNPNPMQSVLNIVSPQTKINTIDVFDISGRKLKSSDLVDETNYSIDLSALQSAVYFVKINTELGSVTKQVIKE